MDTGDTRPLRQAYTALRHELSRAAEQPIYANLYLHVDTWAEGEALTTAFGGVFLKQITATSTGWLEQQQGSYQAQIVIFVKGDSHE